MREKLRKLKSANDGSTLIIVLTVVAFLSIMAVVVTSSALMNYKMKVVNKQSKEVFYTSEDAVDEIYAAMAKLALTCYDDAYSEELALLVKQMSVDGDTYYGYTVSDTTTNKQLRLNFTYRLMNALSFTVSEDNKYDESTLTSMAINTPENREKFVNLINDEFIENVDGLKVVSVEEIKVEAQDSLVNSGLKTYVFSFKNCVVNYLTENSYYSNITFDGQISMPDVYIDFVSDDGSDSLNTFQNYALIGNKGITVNAAGTSSKGVSLLADIYAGRVTGLTVDENAVLTASGITIISAKDVNVNGGTLTAENTDLWCTSIVTGSEYTGALVNINVSGGGSTFVKDDLQVDGNDSTVKIGGAYYGYSYQGTNMTEGNHVDSSAILVNGRNSLVDLENITYMVLGGRGYISYGIEGATAYATGESVSLTGSQEMYLVPNYLMNATNPVVSEPEGGVEVNITEDNFFGYEYLASKSKYTVRTIDGKQYYYLLFKSDDAAQEYVRKLFDDTVYETLTDAQKKSVDYIRDLVEVNEKDLNSTVTAIGGIVNINGEMVSATFETTPEDEVYDSDKYVLNAMDLSNRYSLMTMILKAPAFTKSGGNRNYLYSIGNSVQVYNDVTGSEETVNLVGYSKNDVFGNIVSRSQLEEATSDGYYKAAAPDGLVACAVNVGDTGTLVISDDTVVGGEYIFKDKSGGLIVTQGNVLVEKDFDGLILAGGTITVADGVTVKNTIAAKIKTIIETDETLDKIFNSGDSASMLAVSSADDVTYSDFVTFLNWRKS